MEKIIASHPYFKVERVLSKCTQQIVKHEHVMQLYHTKISTVHRDFYITDVHDLSFRKLGKQEGILYLHTNQGVFSYVMEDDPRLFIQAFKKLINKTC